MCHKIIKALNQITVKNMIEEGRVYGGGMHKLEPKELSKLSAKDLEDLLN